MADVRSVTRRGRARRAPALDPVRWPGRPRRGTVLRAALTVTLLCLACALLYAGPPGGSCPAPAGAPAAPGGGREGDRQAPAERTPPAGMRGVAIRVSEPAVLAVVRSGTRVDLFATPGTANAGGPSLLATGALVLDVMRPETTDGSAALYLALGREQARRTAGVPGDARFTVVVRP